MKQTKWIDNELEKPKRSKWFDVCLLDLGDKIITGWWTGIGWDGLHYKKEQVKKWKWIGNDGMTLG